MDPDTENTTDPAVQPAEARRARMYGPDDLGSFPLFSGDFINFGYWDDDVLNSPHTLTTAQRTRSQQDMYRHVASLLDIGPSHRLLEVGCGIGAGAALLLAEYGPAEIHGVDPSPEQLERAERANAAALREFGGRLSFSPGSAVDPGCPPEHFDRVYSIEAAQHFDDLAGFADHAHRVLRPGGRLAVATFFASDAQGSARLPELIETIRSGIDVVPPVDSLAAHLTAAGFTDLDITSIGAHVWHGYDAWISRTEYRGTWGRNRLHAYRAGLIDYYTVTATA